MLISYSGKVRDEGCPWICSGQCQKHFVCQGTRFILLFCVKLASVFRVGLCLNTQLLHLRAVSDYRVIGIARLYAEFGEYPDPVGEFERLIQHVLAFYVPLGDGVDIVVLQFAWNRICQYNRHMVTQQNTHRSLSADYSYQEKSYNPSNIKTPWKGLMGTCIKYSLISKYRYSLLKLEGSEVHSNTYFFLNNLFVAWMKAIETL